MKHVSAVLVPRAFVQYVEEDIYMVKLAYKLMKVVGESVIGQGTIAVVQPREKTAVVF